MVSFSPPISSSHFVELASVDKKEKKTQIQTLVDQLQKHITDLEYEVPGRNFLACKTVVEQLEQQVTAIKSVRGVKTAITCAERAISRFEKKLIGFVENEVELEEHSFDEMGFAQAGITWLKTRNHPTGDREQLLDQLSQKLQACFTGSQERKPAPVLALEAPLVASGDGRTVKKQSQLSTNQTSANQQARIAEVGAERIKVGKLTKDEKKSLELIQKLFDSSPENKATSLNEVEKKELLTFLQKAIGNKELYRKLKNLGINTTTAQNIIRDIAFLTSDSKKTLQGELQTFTEAIAEAEIEQLSNSEYTIADPTEGAEAVIVACKAAAKNKALATQLNMWKTRLAQVPERDRFEWRRSAENIRLLKEIKAAAPQKSPLLNAVDEYLEEVEKINKIITGWEDKVRESTYKPPLTFDNLRRMYALRNVYMWMQADFLKVYPSIATDSVLKGLYDAGKQCKELTNDLRTVSNLLPLAQSGDVLLHDEKRVKALRGSKAIIYSEQSLLHHPSIIFTMIKDVLSQSFFAVQPYFTGSRLHAAGVYMAPYGKEKNEGWDYRGIEIEGELMTPYFNLQQVSQSVSYRFDASLMPKESVHVLMDKTQKTEKEVIAWVNELYRYKYDTIAHGIKNAEGVLRNCQYRASMAFFKSLARKMLPEPLRKAAIFGASLLLGETGLIAKVMSLASYLQTGKFTEEDGEKIKRKFCSELISQVIQKTIQEVNEEITRELGVGDLLPQIIDVPPDEIHPNLLEEKIQPYFKEVTELPLLARLLLKDEVGRPMLSVKAP